MKGGENMYCKNCGAEINDNAEVCTHCGAETGKGNYKSGAEVVTDGNPFGIASMVCGIAGLVLGALGIFIPLAVIAVILCVVAIVLSVQSKKRVGPNGKATAGLVTGIIGLVLAGIFFITVAALTSMRIRVLGF